MQVLLLFLYLKPHNYRNEDMNFFKLSLCKKKKPTWVLLVSLKDTFSLDS